MGRNKPTDHRLGALRPPRPTVTRTAIARKVRRFTKKHISSPLSISNIIDEDKQYNDARTALNDLETNQSNLFDKYLLTLSASFLGFSVTFYDKIASKNATAEWRELIVCFIVSFMFSVFSVILSLYASSSCCSEYRNQLDSHYKLHGKVIEQYKSMWSTAIPKLNIIALCFFIFGVLSLIFFTVKNI
jgi:hypothetical protein